MKKYALIYNTNVLTNYEYTKGYNPVGAVSEATVITKDGNKEQHYFITLDRDIRLKSSDGKETNYDVGTVLNVTDLNNIREIDFKHEYNNMYATNGTIRPEFTYQVESIKTIHTKYNVFEKKLDEIMDSKELTLDDKIQSFFRTKYLFEVTQDRIPNALTVEPSITKLSKPITQKEYVEMKINHYESLLDTALKESNNESNMEEKYKDFLNSDTPDTINYLEDLNLEADDDFNDSVE